MPVTLDHPSLVIEPANQAQLIAAIEAAANGRQKTSLVPALKSAIISIQHKLNIVMYQSALICNINSDDFRHFEAAMDLGSPPARLSEVSYKGSTYVLENYRHYRLFLSFFVESLAAASFSLFDVVGRLINDVYGLGQTAARTSYKKVVEVLQGKATATSIPVITLLTDHRVHWDPNKNSVNMPLWLPPLEEIRNRTTHRPITDICLIESTGTLYSEIEPAVTSFYLADTLFSPARKKLLCEFVEEVLEGIQSFVEQLYDLLRDATDSQGQLPLS